MTRLVAALFAISASVLSTAAAAQTQPRPKGWCGYDAPAYFPAAQKGDPDAMFCLAIKHSNVGTGVASDDVQATSWFMKAADAGHPGGMFFTGIAFWSGRGVTQDMVEAYKWLDLSTKFATGEQRARTALEGITRVLSAQQIADAKKRAADWERDFQKRRKS